MTDVDVPNCRSATGRGNVISASTYWPLVDAIYGDEDKCLWCGCGFNDHGWRVERTRWFEPYDPTKRQKQRVVWCLPDGTMAIERASRRAQVQVIWCYGCADRLQTAQVVCYKRPQRVHNSSYRKESET